VLPSGEFNGVIQVPLQIYFESSIMIAAVLELYGSLSGSGPHGDSPPECEEKPGTRGPVLAP